MGQKQKLKPMNYLVWLEYRTKGQGSFGGGFTFEISLFFPASIFKYLMYQAFLLTMTNTSSLRPSPILSKQPFPERATTITFQTVFLSTEQKHKLKKKKKGGKEGNQITPLPQLRSQSLTTVYKATDHPALTTRPMPSATTMSYPCFLWPSHKSCQVHQVHFCLQEMKPSSSRYSLTRYSHALLPHFLQFFTHGMSTPQREHICSRY